MRSTGPAVVVFTRDLRVHDHPALAAATRAATEVVPLFVVDPAIMTSGFNRPNRTGFLLECLQDLDGSLRDLGAGLVLRHGDWPREVAAVVAAVRAGSVHVSDDVTGYARGRLDRLAAALRPSRVELVRHEGVTVVAPGAVLPDGRDHFAVFSPYHRRWAAAPWRAVLPAPGPFRLPAGVEPGRVPVLDDLCPGPRSVDVVAGGEHEARRRLSRWTRALLAEYPDRHDDLAGDATSRLSPFLHFGCVSPLEVATELRDRPGGAAFTRQLCWRDFFAQLLAARPDAAWGDYRPAPVPWLDDAEALAAWRAGSTGFPLVDAGMRQLRAEGFMHNRARMVVASFLTKDLDQDWRHGARHFLDLLVDGDVASNNLNWQWCAGTGTDTNPHRIFNPTVQARRFDPDGVYVRRYVPELAGVAGLAVHDPPPLERAARGYPLPLVDHHAAIAGYRARRT
jgi:deoxyribodipyrimidine photo-lyase